MKTWCDRAFDWFLGNAPDSIGIDNVSVWEVIPVDKPRFISEFLDWVEPGSILDLEGRITPFQEEALSPFRSMKERRVRRVIVWPKPSVLDIRVDSESLPVIKALMDGEDALWQSAEIRVYKNDKLFIAAYHTLFDVFLTIDFPEQTLRNWLCEGIIECYERSDPEYCAPPES